MEWLFDTSEFVTRSHCGTGWTSELTSIYRLAALVTFLSYLLIPFILVWAFFWNRKKHFSFGVVPPFGFITFSAFILFCGLGHLCDVLVFNWAPYRLFVLIDCVTGITSAMVVGWMLYTVPQKIAEWEEMAAQAKMAHDAAVRIRDTLHELSEGRDE